MTDYVIDCVTDYVIYCVTEVMVGRLATSYRFIYASEVRYKRSGTLAELMVMIDDC